MKSVTTVYIEMAALNRVADLVQDGNGLPEALRITANELGEYYEAFIGTKVQFFDLTQWVLNGKPTKNTPDEPA